MGTRKTQLPRIPEPNEHNTLAVLRAIKEIIEVGVRGVNRGDPLDSYVTFRDVADGNTSSENLLGYATGATSGVSGVTPGTDSNFPNPVDLTNLHLPGRPTNVRTQSVWDGIMVLWDWPENTDGLVTWDRAAIWSAATDNFVDGELVGYSATDFYVHQNIGPSSVDPDNPDDVTLGVRYYWVRFEWANPLTGELEVTEWTPYDTQQGIRGQTSVDIEWWIENFTLGSSANPEYDAIKPFIVGTLTDFDENGDPYERLAIGLDGHLLINGTIHANAIQAGTIGAREIYAQEIWAGLMTANNIISSQFTTRDVSTGDWRLEINGEGTTYENYPLWYGRGETGGDNGLFWIQRYLTDADSYVSSMFLSGEMYVTGIGKFFAGNVLFDEEGIGQPDLRSMRIEIGGPGTDFLLWAGSGLTGTGDVVNPDLLDPELESKPVFFIDNFGNAVFRGTVEAEFVSGEISRTAIIYKDEEEQVPPPPKKTDPLNYPEEYWLIIDEYELPEPPFDTGHIPFIMISFSMYGFGEKAGATRLQYKTEPDGEWVTFHMTTHDISTYGGERSISSILPFERRNGKTWFRFSAAGVDGQRPFIAAIRGIIFGIR